MVEVTPKTIKSQLVNNEKSVLHGETLNWKEFPLHGQTLTWKEIPEEETVIPVITLTDPATGIELAASYSNRERRVGAHNAWAGARHSRAPGTTSEIMKEMGEKGIDRKSTRLNSSH